MKREELLRERLKRYSASETAAFHMPGHKRHMEYGLLRDFPQSVSIDITEIDGFDNLHHPEGILKAAQQRMARICGADQSFFLVNGSTAGLLAAISAAVPRGGKILLARNCHKAAYHAVFSDSYRSHICIRHLRSLEFREVFCRNRWGKHWRKTLESRRFCLLLRPMMVWSQIYRVSAGSYMGMAFPDHR